MKKPGVLWNRLTISTAKINVSLSTQHSIHWIANHIRIRDFTDVILSSSDFGHSLRVLTRPFTIEVLTGLELLIPKYSRIF